MIADHRLHHSEPYSGGPLSQYAQIRECPTGYRAAGGTVGLNRPLWIQYFDWAWRLVQATGAAPSATASVLAVIGQHVFATLLLMVPMGDRDRHRHLNRHRGATATIRCLTIWQRSAPWLRYRFRPSGSDLSGSTSSPCSWVGCLLGTCTVSAMAPFWIICTI